MISYIQFPNNMDIFSAIITVCVLIPSVILHEVAHGLLAEKLGDPTARIMGRLTLDPRKHIDPFMTILLPVLTSLSSGGAIILGAAKPVPVDPFNLRDGRKDIALVSLVGPLTNILIAVIAAMIFRLINLGIPSLYETSFVVIPALLVRIAEINLLLAIFNLLPIPPLDGSKIFALILPEKEARVYLSLSSIGIFIIFFLFLIPIDGFSLSNLIYNFFSFSLKLLGI